MHDLLLASAVEYRRGCLGPRLDSNRCRASALEGLPTLCCGPPEVGLQDLAQVHTGRDAKRRKNDVDRSPILHERHLFFGKNLGDHTLVAVTTGELVTL